MSIRVILAGLVATCIGASAQGATLGLMTSAPTLGASDAVVEYLEFGDEGDLSAFGAVVDAAGLAAPTGLAEIDFGIGFSLDDPEADAAGGFSIFDDDGLYLTGDLIALGFRAYAATSSIIELHFGSLSGHGTSEWTETVLMTIVLPGIPDNPFDHLFDGDVLDASIGLFAVNGYTPPPEIPLPASAFLLLAGVAGLSVFTRRRGNSS